MSEVRFLDKTSFVEKMREQLTINPIKTAIVVVDMHQGHLDPDMATMLVPLNERVSVLKNAKKLIKIARLYKIPIIHVITKKRPIKQKRHINPFRIASEIVKEKIRENSFSWHGKQRLEKQLQPKIMPEVAPKPEDYIIDSKKTYSAFLGTDLEHLLKVLDINTLIIIGINTNTCVQCSAFEAVNRGYKLIIISDCVASAYGIDLHISSLQNISRCLGWVLTINEFKTKLFKK
jgi:nicotinamidase-related amidase